MPGKLHTEAPTYDINKRAAQRTLKKISIIALVVSLTAIIGEVFIFATRVEDNDETHRKAIKSDYRVYAPVIPETMTFAGERVPLDEYYVRESLDRELVSLMYYQSSTVLIIKRANRYFPEIERILRENGVPEDFKYLCVAESSLTNATSPAKAKGFWQFVKNTGQSYGLTINDEVDMRNDLEASTNAACKFLKAMHDQLGSWTSAAAAYNCGMGGLKSNMSRQSEYSYYNLRLNNETSRYLFRIIAYKTIMQDLKSYGYHLRRCDLYPVLPYRTDTLAGRNIDICDYARTHGCNYKVFRAMNPWITTDKLKNAGGMTYRVKVPIANGTKMSTITKGHKDTSLVDKM